MKITFELFQKLNVTKQSTLEGSVIINYTDDKECFNAMLANNVTRKYAAVLRTIFYFG